MTVYLWHLSVTAILYIISRMQLNAYKMYPLNTRNTIVFVNY